MEDIIFTRNDRPILGRDAPAFDLPETHAALGTRLVPPFPEGLEIAVFGMGCFWSAERLFWQLGGVYSTAAGYAGGTTPNPTYRETSSGRTGHAEVVQVVFDPEHISYADLLRTFWEEHDPTRATASAANTARRSTRPRTSRHARLSAAATRWQSAGGPRSPPRSPRSARSTTPSPSTSSTSTRGPPAPAACPRPSRRGCRPRTPSGGRG